MKIRQTHLGIKLSVNKVLESFLRYREMISSEKSSRR